MGYRKGSRELREKADQLTWGEAKSILAAAKAKGLHGKSKLNPQLTKQQVYDLFSEPPARVHSDSDLLGKTDGGYLVAQNILREFG